jgi:Domain of unknown function (DUF4406)
MRTLIYLSSAITLGDADYNLYIANATESRLLQAGYAVINPMRSMLALGAQRALSYEAWLENDFRLISGCDLVCRLPTDSAGAERECDFARSRQIPVVGPAYFPSLKELFPDETEMTYCRDDDRNLMRFRREQRRAAGLPALPESDPRLIPFIVEGFNLVK